MKRISCLLFAAAMLCFTGCQHDIVDDKASVSYDGYWETFKVRMGDEVYEDYYLDPQIPVSAVYSLALTTAQATSLHRCQSFTAKRISRL